MWYRLSNINYSATYSSPTRYRRILAHFPGQDNVPHILETAPDALRTEVDARGEAQGAVMDIQGGTG